MFSSLTSLLTCEGRLSRSLLLGLFVATAGQASALSMPQRVFGAGSSHAYVCPGSAPAAVPYLAQVGPAPLRFAPPPPEPTERPSPPETKPTVTPVVVAPEPISTPTVAPVPATHPETPVDTGPKPVRILPDDTPHEVRPEDVLPYFQLPRQGDRASGSGLNLPFTPAVPATLPPSSATYQLK